MMSKIDAANRASNLQTLIFVATFIVALGLGGLMLFRSFRTAQRKGYTSPVFSVLFAASFFACIGLGLIVAANLGEKCWNCSAQANPEYFLSQSSWFDSYSASAAFAIGFMIATGLVVITTALLPNRRRRAGPRITKAPWRLISIMFITLIPAVLGAAVIASLVWSRIDFLTAMKIAGQLTMVLLAGYFAAKRLDARTGQPSADAELHADHRAPVLYLRSFAHENRPFAKTEPGLRRPGINNSITIDEYLGATIRQRLGPFVALGNPWDYLPVAGASREYLEDEAWQQEFFTLSGPGHLHHCERRLFRESEHGARASSIERYAEETVRAHTAIQCGIHCHLAFQSLERKSLAPRMARNGRYFRDSSQDGECISRPRRHRNIRHQR